MSGKTKEIIKILEEVLKIVNSNETDIVWSHYNTVDELEMDLHSLIVRVKTGDKKVLEDLKFLFAPTSSLQEISISSGWGNEFLDIAKRIDNLTS